MQAVVGGRSLAECAVLETRMLLRQASANAQTTMEEPPHILPNQMRPLARSHASFSDGQALRPEDCEIPATQKDLLQHNLLEGEIQGVSPIIPRAQHSNQQPTMDKKSAFKSQQSKDDTSVVVSLSKDRSDDDDDMADSDEPLKLELEYSSAASSPVQPRSPDKSSQPCRDMNTYNSNTQFEEKDRIVQQLQATFGWICDPVDLGDRFALEYLSEVALS